MTTVELLDVSNFPSKSNISRCRVQSRYCRDSYPDQGGVYKACSAWKIHFQAINLFKDMLHLEFLTNLGSKVKYNILNGHILAV